MQPDLREQKGRQIAQQGGIHRVGRKWRVPSQSGIASSYIVDLIEQTCTCLDFTTRSTPSRRIKCKHVHAGEFFVIYEVCPDGSVSETVGYRRNQTPRNWPAINAAMKNEKRHFEHLLAMLCGFIEQPQQVMGAPRHRLRDLVYACAHKVYTGKAGREASDDWNRCAGSHLTREVSYNSMFRAMEDPAATPILKAMIDMSAMVLRDFETQFAQDATFFGTRPYHRSFDHKYGGTEAEREACEAEPKPGDEDDKWVKLHAFVGTRTNVIVGACVSPRGDSPMLKPLLLDAVAAGFNVREVSADKAYLSHDNVALIRSVGALPFIPPKVNTVPGKGPQEWRDMIAFFLMNTAKWEDHFHRRSNCETSFWMVKSKTGPFVRSKLPVAQANEVYAKCVCHNLCCIIMSMYESGLVPQFLAPTVTP